MNPKDKNYWTPFYIFLLFIAFVLFLVGVWLTFSNRAGAHEVPYIHFHSHLVAVNGSSLTDADPTNKPRPRPVTLKPIPAPLLPTIKRGKSQEQALPIFCINPRVLGAGSGTMICTLAYH